jgi:hypothetical protein
MAQMLTGQQYAPGGCTDRCTRIVLFKNHATSCEGVNIGRLNFLLSIYPQFPVSEVICKDIDDIGMAAGIITRAINPILTPIQRNT